MPFGFFRKLTGSPPAYLGIDIGTNSIKVVQLERDRGKAKLVDYAIFEATDHLERVNTALQTSALKLYDQEIADYLKLIIGKSRFIAKEVIASLPPFAVFSTVIDVPPMPPKELEQTLLFKAKQYVPLPMETVTIDWVKVGEKTAGDGTSLQQIFLVSLPNDQVQKYKRIFQLAGLNLTALEVEGFSLARALTRGDDEPVLIVDIGARSSTFLVARNGLLKSMGQSDFAGGSLTQSLASGLGINVRRAEDLKKQKGLTGLGYAPEEELSTLLLPLLDVIISEVKRVKEGYESSYQQAVKKVILTGGGANLPGIEKYFSDQLGAVIVKANPFSQMQFSPKLEPLVSNIGPLLSVAVGLALKPFV